MKLIATGCLRFAPAGIFRRLLLVPLLLTFVVSCGGSGAGEKLEERTSEVAQRDAGVAVDGGGSDSSWRDHSEPEAVGDGGAVDGKGQDTVGDSPGTTPDANRCATPGACPCFMNDDCPVGYYCKSVDGKGEKVYCIPGKRGTGKVGDTCSREEDCSSALCMEGRCTGKCEKDDDCPSSMPRCLAMPFQQPPVKICFPPKG